MFTCSLKDFHKQLLETMARKSVLPGVVLSRTQLILGVPNASLGLSK